jgi:hypothetical protein
MEFPLLKAAPAPSCAFDQKNRSGASASHCARPRFGETVAGLRGVFQMGGTSPLAAAAPSNL